MKRLVIFILIISMLFSFSACANSANTDSRKTVTVAVFGQAAQMEKLAAEQLNSVNPKYRVELVSYGADESGYGKLIADLNTGGKIDVLISEGYYFEPGINFADLYLFIDNDAEIKREDFIKPMLSALEKDGALRQIWTRFGMTSAIAYGALADEPKPLKITECQNVLDKYNFDDPLFDSYYSREDILSFMADGILGKTFENGVSELDTPYTRAMIELCSAQPEKISLDEDEDYYVSEFLQWRDISPEYLRYLEKENIAYRIFDGAGGGDNFCTIAAWYRSCIMIPESCMDKEKAWDYVRVMLMPDYQKQQTADGQRGFPANVEALQETVDFYLGESGRNKLLDCVDRARVCDFETYTLRGIFIDCVHPYLYGDYPLETALRNAQGKINIFMAEREK